MAALSKVAETRFAFADLLLGGLQSREIEREPRGLAQVVAEQGETDQDGHSGAIGPQVFLLVRRAVTLLAHERDGGSSDGSLGA